jgi:flagellar biosynthesis protein FlhA
VDLVEPAQACRTASRSGNRAASAQTDPSRITLDEVSDHTLVTIELGYGLVHLVDEKRGSPLVARITGVRKQLSQACGFIVPQFRVRDARTWPNEYRILLGGVRIGGAVARPDRILAIDAAKRAPATGLSAKRPATQLWLPALWIDPASATMPSPKAS